MSVLWQQNNGRCHKENITQVTEKLGLGLLDKEIVTGDDYGYVTFVLPLFDEYVKTR